jgi:hypothetical protein
MSVDPCPTTGKRRYPGPAEAETARAQYGHADTYMCRHGCGGWHTTSQAWHGLNADRRRQRQRKARATR